MYRPRDLRRMEEYWLTRLEWFLITSMEGLAILSGGLCVFLAGMGAFILCVPQEGRTPEESLELAMALFSVPFLFSGAVLSFLMSLALLLVATVVRFRGSFRLLIHQNIPTPVSGSVTGRSAP